MKEYLKMDDVFVGEYKPAIRRDSVPAHRYGESSVELYGIPANYAAHAINSHDELVAEVERLQMLELGAAQLERLKKACTNMGIATPESVEDLGIAQHHYIRMLINATIEM